MDFITFLDIKLIAKLFLMVLAVFYFIFSVIVYRQIALMTQTLNSNISPTVRLVSIIQIVAVAALFLLVTILA